MDGGSGQRGRRSSDAAAFGEEGPTGGGFGLERCSLKDAAASEEGLTKACSTERKAAAGEEGLTKGCSTERKAAAGEEGLTKGRSTERKAAASEEVLTKGRSTERKAAVEEGAPAAGVRMTRLSRMEVARCLSRDPRSTAPYSLDSLRRLVREERPNVDVPDEVLRAVAESFNEGMRKKFIVFQNWVLGQLEEKGYVEVPEQFIKEREEIEKRQGGKIDLYLPDRYFTTVSDNEGDGKGKLVFAFQEKEEEVASEPKSKKENVILSYTAEMEPEIEAIFS